MKLNFRLRSRLAIFSVALVSGLAGISLLGHATETSTKLNAESRPSGPPAGPSDTPAQFDEMMQNWIEKHPDVVYNAVNRYVAEVKGQQAKAKAENIVQNDGQMMQVDGLPFIGRADAPVTMIYFLDAACHYCRRELPEMLDLVAKNPDVKIVHRWVPFLTPSSVYAGRVAGVVFKRYPSKYQDFYRELMSQRENLTDAVVDGSVLAVLGSDAVDAVKSEAVAPKENDYASQVTENNRLARLLGIDGTPFHYVHGAGLTGVIPGAVEMGTLNAGLIAARGAAGVAPAAPVKD